MSQNSEAVGASKALRNVVKRQAEIRRIQPIYSSSPRHDVDEGFDALEHNHEIMKELAIAAARAQGKPFRNPFVRKGERLYPVR